MRNSTSIRLAMAVAMIIAAIGCGGGSSSAEYESIFEACLSGDLDAVKGFLSQGATVQDTDEDGMTPLHYAAAGDSRDVMEYLIKQGADIHATSNDGLTPLQVGVQSNSEWAEVILEDR